MELRRGNAAPAECGISGPFWRPIAQEHMQQSRFTPIVGHLRMFHARVPAVAGGRGASYRRPTRTPHGSAAAAGKRRPSAPPDFRGLTNPASSGRFRNFRDVVERRKDLQNPQPPSNINYRILAKIRQTSPKNTFAVIALLNMNLTRMGPSSHSAS